MTISQGSLGRCFSLIAARQYSRSITQNHRTLGIIFNGGFVEHVSDRKAMILPSIRSTPVDLAAIAEQFNGVAALHA